MAKLDFRGLVPGKRYKIVVKPKTIYGTLDSFPSIDFIVPEAPPRARNHRLRVNTVFKNKTIKKNRKLRIYKYKIELINSKKIVVISTSPLSAKKKNKVKPGDRVSVSMTPPSGKPDISATDVRVLDRKNKNRIRYEHPNPNISTVGWTEYPADNNASPSAYPITHLNSKTVTIKKAKYVRIRIPKQILQNLIWNDDVKDFVFVVYIKGKKKSRLQNRKRRYFWDTDDTPILVNPQQPPRLVATNGTFNPINDSNTSVDVSDFPYGHPATFRKEITDDKYYQFQFIVARYVRTESIDATTGNTVYIWTGSWIERNTPFFKRLSRATSWRSK